jgi:hypothetical protein
MSILGSLLGTNSNRPQPSETMQNNAGGLMSRFNPLNLASGMFGTRKPGAADNYAGSSDGMKKGLKNKKDPRFVTKSVTSETPVQKGDSVTNIAAKLFVLFKDYYDEKNKEEKIKKNSEKSMEAVRDKRNKELIEALTTQPKNLKKETKDIKKHRDQVKKEIPKQPATPKSETQPPTAAAGAPKGPSATPAAPKGPPATPPVSAAPAGGASTATRIGVGAALGITSAASFAAGPLAENIVAHESKISSPMKGKKTKWKNNSEYNAYNKGTVKKGGRDVTLSASFDASGESDHDFSKMTIEEYLERGKLKSGDERKIFAVGRYQIIPITMESLVKSLKIDPKTTYLTPETQDYLFTAGLIGTKRKKVKSYLEGDPTVTRDAAILELAMEFASIGVPYDITVGKRKVKKGQSYYAQNTASGKALNPPEDVGKALDAQRKLTEQKKTPTSVPQKGDSLNKKSSELKDLKDQRASAGGTVIVNQNNNIVASADNSKTMTTPRSDGSRFVQGVTG